MLKQAQTRTAGTSAQVPSSDDTFAVIPVIGV
jgi:hypothetical protein